MHAEDAARGIEQANDGMANQSIIIDNGKYMAVVVILAVLCGASAIYAWHAAGIANDADTHYEVLLNHQTKIESRLEYVESELKELKHAKQ